MAIQISSDLGLHLDFRADRTLLETAIPGLNMSEIRANLFWTVNSLDR